MCLIPIHFLLEPTMTRTHAIAQAAAHFDSGDFFRVLQERVACPTECQVPSRASTLLDYLQQQLQLQLTALGFDCQVLPNPVPDAPPFMVARRIEQAAAFTVLGHGHGDGVRGHEGQWRENRSPWDLQASGDRWYGRGAADNKGQHTINLAALAEVITARGGQPGRCQGPHSGAGFAAQRFARQCARSPA